MDAAMFVYSWKICASGKRLAKHLDIPCYSPKFGRPPVQPKVLFNWGYWGCKLPIYYLFSYIVNSDRSVYQTADKVLAYQIMQEHQIPVPDWTITHCSAKILLDLAPTHTILARKNHCKGGRGIQVVSNPDEIPYADFYTVFIDKQWEGRAHVFQGKILDIVEKRPLTVDAINSVAWNKKQGFKFFHELSITSEQVKTAKELSARAVNIFQLDFGVVDIILDHGQFYILEVNTAPGVSIPRTIEAYVEGLTQIYNSKIEEIKNDTRANRTNIT